MNSVRDVQCSIGLAHLGSFSDVISFEAVSYAWGPPDSSHFLHLDDNTSVLRTSQRVRWILHRLVQMDGTRQVWIDAICINQGDSIEKGHQVAMMSKIFRRASTVHIFLTDTTANWHQSEWFHRTWGKQLQRFSHAITSLADPVVVSAYAFPFLRSLLAT